jgi:hypothetical protein
MHLLLDKTPTTWTKDIVRQIAFNGWRYGNGPIDSEDFALCAALEYLLPWRHRPASLDTVDSLEVAKRFKIPKHFVETFYESGYAAKSAALNQELDEVDEKFRAVQDEPDEP